MSSILLLTNFFENKGGWVTDSQFLIQNNTIPIMAHGIGKPVEDASTSFEVSEDGKYYVWVRTRDWTRRWSRKGSAGLFKVLVDGQALDAVLGNEKLEWSWQSGGKLALAKGRHTVALHDLTGFDGRCDAILLTTGSERPDDSPEALGAMRRDILGIDETPIDKGSYDFVVCGGGIGGMCAAIAAARLGCRVALIQDRPVLGGNNSSEIRVALGGRCNIRDYPSLGYLKNATAPDTNANARHNEIHEDERKMDVIKAEKNITLFMGYTVVAVEKESENLIKSVIAVSGEDFSRIRISGKLFSDSTGDSWIGHFSGADMTYGRESKADYNEVDGQEVADRMTMGASIMWYGEETDGPVEFPHIEWGLDVDEKNVQVVHRGQWYWEGGMRLDMIWEAERIRDYGMYVAYSNWEYLKHSPEHSEAYKNCSLEWLSYILGKRESNRMLGDFVLRQQDIIDFIRYEDGTVATSWNIDQHFPDPENEARFPGEAYLSRATLQRVEYYPVPYRCFYSRNINNLFMTGRNISSTHMALGTVRVMRTIGMIGEVVGMAASICRNHNALPSDVYKSYLCELKALMEKGVGKTNIPYTQIYTLIENDPGWREDN
ncbi:MAG: FAD-dependent oxidoreductase [Bacteroidales bacterium]|nr:FAD-dependent oxidoreductase [Bacteroidales bacterium]